MRHLRGEIGTSMNSFKVTNELKKHASSGTYNLGKEEKKAIKKHNRELREAKRQMQQHKTKR